MSQRKPKISVRRPPAADIDAFVASGEAPVAEPAPTRPALQVVESSNDDQPVEPTSNVIEATESAENEADEATIEVPQNTMTTRTGIVTRADGRKRRRRTVYLPPVLDKKLAIYCAINEVEASDFVAQALESALSDATMSF